MRAVGIGDMSGDVFGNGMLLSRSLKLIAAYDHRHVFLDPDPDPERSFAERERLFELSGSSWDDYDREAISAGGGVFSRDAKSIALTPQVRRALDITDEALAPTDLIRAILRAPVDLLWNGGIGTVVKASTESDADALDRSSDAIRVDGREVRARVVGEGGNLGFTHRARIEYANAGGHGGRGRAHQRRLHRQLGGRRLLRPRGQPEDLARPRRAARGAAPRRARRAARRGHRGCCRTRVVRLVPAGADPVAGGALERHARLRLRGPDGRAGGRQDPAPARRGAAADRRHGRAPPRRPRPRAPGAGRARRLRQAAADRCAAGVRPARRGGLRPRRPRLLPAAGRRALRPPDRRAPAAPRAGRDAGGQRRRRRARPDVRLRPQRRVRRRARRGRARLPDRPRGDRRDPALAGDRGPGRDDRRRCRVAAARRGRRPRRRRRALVPAARARRRRRGDGRGGRRRVRDARRGDAGPALRGLARGARGAGRSS